MNSNIKILQSKLKRNNISCVIEGQRVFIGNAKVNPITLLLIILSLLVTATIVYLTLLTNYIKLKFIFFAIVSLGTALFYIKRIVIKYRSNDKEKILYNNRLQIDNLYFDSENIHGMHYKIDELKEDEEYQGTLYLRDSSERIFLIFQIEEESGSLIEKEMNWFLDFFADYLKFKL